MLLIAADLSWALFWHSYQFNASLIRVGCFGVFVDVFWHVVNNQWMMSECGSARAAWLSSTDEKLIWCFCKEFLWKWSKNETAFIQRDGGNRSKGHSWTVHTHTQTHTGTKTDLNKCQQITPVFINTASGNNIINLRKPLGRAFNCLFFCCCFFPLVKVRKTCNSGSVAKCQTTWKIIKTDHLKTPTRPDGPMSL